MKNVGVVFSIFEILRIQEKVWWQNIAYWMRNLHFFEA
jgi:hypothetical protein